MAVFYINGRETEVTKNQKLLRYLRDTLHLTSVKDGCSEGACGACTVLIDGEPIRACTPDTDSLEGRHILTRGRSRPVRLLHSGHGALHQGSARQKSRPHAGRYPQRPAQQLLPLHRLCEDL